MAAGAHVLISGILGVPSRFVISSNYEIKNTKLINSDRGTAILSIGNYDNNTNPMAYDNCATFYNNYNYMHIFHKKGNSHAI